MNVFLQKQFWITFIIMLAVPILAVSQAVKLETFQGTPANFSIESFRDPSITTGPTNGTVDHEEEPDGTFNFSYTPDIGFIGIDQIQFTVWTTFLSFEYVVYEITVLPSKVEAVQDYVTSIRDLPIQVNALENDITSNGGLYLKSIPLVNNGTASFSAGTPFIDFQPSPGFEGVAHINYVVCDNIGTCDHGTVSVNVIGESTRDTTLVFTKKNKIKEILAPDLYALVIGPANGTYDTGSEIPMYAPNADFIGRDYITYEYDGAIKVFAVEVLDITDNIHVVDDVIHTNSYDVVEYNVLENDVYGINNGCFDGIVDQPEFGTLSSDRNGNIIYEPSPGFYGVDKFTYRGGNPRCRETEIATVYIYVSNFEPASTKFEMVTPKLTPLVIGYNVPISSYSFEIADQGELGEVLLLEGEQNITLYGQEISGYNLMIYVPNEDVTSGVDEFEINFCTNNIDGNCIFQKSVKIEVEILDIGEGDEPMCFKDCVWPGDTNSDGVVNMEDLLPLGICMGEIGKPRTVENPNLWYGQTSINWNDPFEESPVDLKHLDTDGDSVVTAFDTSAISQFYGRTHGIVPSNIPFSEHQIILRGNIFANPGDLIELDVVLGDPSQPAVDIYGFTFPFLYEPNFFAPESVQLDFDGGSWLGYNSPILYMVRNDNDGTLESGFTRTNGVSASGFGEIGKVRLIVSDDIIGFKIGDEKELTVNVGGGMATMMNSAGQTFGINVQDLQIHINLEEVEEEEELDIVTPDLLKVYPNPTRDFLNVHLNGGHEFDQVLVHNVTGQELLNLKINSNRARLNVSKLDNGIYFLSIRTKNGVVNKKFEIMK